MPKPEIEAKFALPDRRVHDQLLAVESLAGFTAGERTIQRVVDHYLDTPGRAILAAGYACRVRAEATGQTLTVKSLGRPGETIKRREEHTAELAPAACFWQMQYWPVCPVRALVEELLRRGEHGASGPLEILLILHQTRHVYPLNDGDRPVVELSLDEVLLGPGEPVLELEAELLPGGTEEELCQVIQALADEWGLIASPLSKIERGLGALEGWDGLEAERLSVEERLALTRVKGSGQVDAAHTVLLWDAGLRPQTISAIIGSSEPRVMHWLEAFRDERMASLATSVEGSASGSPVPMPCTSAKHADILPEDPMSEAGRKTLRLHFERMLAHEPGTRVGADIEELHDMRVATRRMRAAFRVFGPHLNPEAIAPYLQGLKRTGRALGPVRDLDVFGEKVQLYIDELPADSAGALDSLLAERTQERDTARGQMLAYLDSQVYSGFVQQFGAFLSTKGAGARAFPPGKPVPHQVRHVAPRLIYARYEKVRAYELVLEEATIEMLHALRIDFKRLRYTLEFFVPVLGPEASSIIEGLEGIQDHLGDLNDADVASQILEGYLQRLSDLPEAGRRGMSGYLQRRREECQRLLQTFPAVWERFARPEMRRNLALAVAVL